MSMASITFANFDPPWLWITVGLMSLAVIAMTYRQVFARSGRPLTWTLMALRCLGVLALWLALVKPTWTRIIEHEEKPQLAAILDDSQSMSVTCSADNESRYQAARRWLTQSPAGRSLEERFNLRVFNLAGEELGINALPAEPLAEETDLVRALRTVGNRLRGQAASGILLLSDGHDTTARDNYLLMRDQPVPVYCLGFQERRGNVQGTPDLSILSITAPDKVLVHNTATIEVLVGKNGGDAAGVPVQIEHAGVPVATRRELLPAGRTEKMVRIGYTPEEPGDFVLAVRIPTSSGDLTTHNNTKLFRIRVEATPIRVLYVEGFLRMEYTFLHAGLGQDPDVDLISFVRSAGPDQTGAQGILMGRELITAERLKKIDVVVLGDFEAGMLDESTYRLLHDWVADGGGLIVAGGYHTLGRNGLVRTPLNDALPVELGDISIGQIEEPFAFSLTPEGMRHPVATITGDAARDAELWQALPKLAGIVAVQRARPGATVLARHPRRNPVENAGYIVLAAQPFGKGRVMAFTADTTWRWSRVARLKGEPDALYARFWSQIVRYLAKRDPQSERTALTVSTDTPEVNRGQRVTVRVRRNPAVMLPGSEGEAGASVEITVRAPDGRQAVLPVQGDPADANVWTAPFFADRGGRYEATAKLVGSDVQGRHDRASQVTEFIVRGSDLELNDASPNPAALGRIAQLSGGVYTDLDDPDGVRRIIDSLPAEATVTREQRTAGLWNSPLLFLLFLGLVTVEWLMRRRHLLL